MKSYIVIDKKGEWKLMTKNDAHFYQQFNDYEVKNILKFLLPILHFSIKTGILISILVLNQKITQPNLMLGFQMLILLEIIRAFSFVR